MSERQAGAIERFRAAVFADEQLQADLGAAEDWPTFSEKATAAAQRLGVEPDALDLRPRADPLGLLRFEAPAGAPPATPQRGWRPAQVAWDGREFVVDWAYFGARRLEAPFYEGDLRSALARPFNILFRFRTPLSELSRWTAALPSRTPSGLIFHMSRCGSTLVSQMLAASPSNVVVSEAQPIDTLLQVGGAAHAGLAPMVGALGHAAEGEQRCFIKFEAWHILAIRAFRAAFPDTPWVFLYRDPVEVVVSHLSQPAPLAPSGVLAAVCGDETAQGPGADSVARVLGAFCRAALEAHAGGGGLLVNYDELPDALWSRILPHFSVAPGETERAAMAGAAQYNAKAPWLAFTADAEAKKRQANDEVREACRRRLGETYRQLEAARGDLDRTVV